MLMFVGYHGVRMVMFAGSGGLYKVMFEGYQAVRLGMFVDGDVRRIPGGKYVDMRGIPACTYGIFC